MSCEMDIPAINEALDKLLLELTWARPYPSHTITQYRRVSEKFLHSVDGIPTSEDVKRFVAEYPSPGGKKFVFSVLKVLFFSSRWPWEFRKSPFLAERRKSPALSYDEVAQLIASRNLLDERDNAYIALSTTYGFRRGELARLSSANFNDGRITVQALKRNLLRVHRIPDEIEDIVLGYRFAPLSDSYLSKIFQRIFRRLGMEHKWGYGWHSVRHALVDELRRQVSDRAITTFMGWQTTPLEPGVSRMVDVYSRPVPEEAEGVVFSNHPFLAFYRK